MRVGFLTTNPDRQNVKPVAISAKASCDLPRSSRPETAHCRTQQLLPRANEAVPSPRRV